MPESVALLDNGEIESIERLLQQQRALSRWDGEGGAGPEGPQDGSLPVDERTEMKLTEGADLAELRVRMTTLETLMIALLTEAFQRQHERAREMATWIAPGTDFSDHPAMIRTSTQMIDLTGEFGLFPSTSD